MNMMDDDSEGPESVRGPVSLRSRDLLRRAESFRPPPEPPPMRPPADSFLPPDSFRPPDSMRATDSFRSPDSIRISDSVPPESVRYEQMFTGSHRPTTTSGGEALDLFSLASGYFHLFRGELEEHGVNVSPTLQVKRGPGMLSYYSYDDGNIYLSLPESHGIGRLQAAVYAEAFGCRGTEEFMQFFRLILMRLVAHELGHHLRHRARLLTDDNWREEQIANRIATALTRRRLSPPERKFLADILGRTQAVHAADRGEGHSDAVITYHDILRAMNAAGRIDEDTLEHMQVVQGLLHMRPEEMLEGRFRDEHIKRRGELIKDLNAEYGSEPFKYLRYHTGWMLLDIASQTGEYIDEIARLYLGLESPMLPLVKSEGEPTEEQIMALYEAYRRTRDTHRPVSRYFYKRYRRLFWEKLRSNVEGDKSSGEAMAREASFFLEGFRHGQSDPLRYLAVVAAPSLKRLHPGRIEAEQLEIDDTERALPTETDRRLFRRAALGDDDAAAKETLSRLSILDRTDSFRSMPAESMLEVAQHLCRVYVRPGEAVIWEGEVNDDVFFLESGALDVKVGRGRHLGVIKPGEVFGEMAFFSRDRRNATVRASLPSTCFVLKDTDLLRLGFRHPSVLMEMAGVLTRRLMSRNQMLDGSS